MKKIELELSAISHSGDKDYEYHINTVLGVLRELVDAHNELLDTHTVKEEPLKNWKGCPDCFYGEGEDHDIECESLKEEPTTPEKKCTDLRHMGMGESFYCPSPIHQEKLPTSYYEVTCGRREKSIKHSCGVVRDWQSEREDYLSGK